MSADYLNRVLIYLQQELPEDYRQRISLSGDRLIISQAETANFSQAYEILHPAIINSINRIRNREIDLEFTIRSKNQERDFKILKQYTSSF
jgi:hypothetical protein